MTEIVTKLLSDLIRDREVFPRQDTDQFNVDQLATVVRDGGLLPPLVIDQNARVLDGWHRFEAYKAVHGLAHEVKCEVVYCVTDYEALTESARRNWKHGKRLASADRVLVVSLAKRFGATAAQLAKDIGIPVATVTSLAQTRTPASRPISTPRRSDAMGSAADVSYPRSDREFGVDGGTSPVDRFIAIRNAIHLVENNALLPENSAHVELALKLYAVSKAWLEKVKVAA